MSEAVPTPDNAIGVPRGNGLLATKLYPRPARANLVSRPRLIKLLDDGLSASLILVSAPAGFGKTTLLAEWLRNRPHGSCWLSLDAADNDPARFLSYVIAALQKAVPGVASDLVAPLRSLQPPAAEAVVTALVNELAPVPDSLILVLDGYHVITSTAVNGAVTFLLENLPPNLHLVISTRSDPPIPIARLRSRGQVVEIRADDLRFTPDEAAAFLGQTMGLALSSEQVATLDERAEGWIAGLQMAALSMRGREDVDSFIRAFAGTHRFIMDFMLEEVLAREPEEVQTFLLQTAILTRLTGPLCDTVTGASGGQDMLERLERRNLFLVPLDDERIWYRYHYLFADLLRARLQQTLKTQDIAVLHMRAAQWYEQYGLTYEAIHHASLTSDNEWVERLIEQGYMEMFQRRDSSSIAFWTGELSKELIYKRPRLCIHEAMSRSWLGQVDDADLFLDEAEKRIREEASTPETQAMLGHLAYVRSRVTAMRGDVHRAIELGLAARDNTPPSNQALLGGIGVMLGYGYFLDGDFPNAIQTLNETIQSGTTASAINSTMGAYCVLARLYAVQGQLHRSFELYQEAGKLAHGVGGRDRGIKGIVNAGIADVLYEWNDLEAALTHMEQGMEFLPLWGKADDMALAYTTYSRILQAQGNTAVAAETLEKGSQLIHTRGVFSEARDAVVTAEIRLRLAQGNILAVGHWASSLGKGCSSGDPFRFENELAHITLVRVYLAQKKLDESIGLLSHLEANAQSGGRTGRLVEILILKALAMQKMGNSAQADIALTNSLALAEPGGYVRVFLDEGQPMRMLLAQWLAHASASPLRDYAIHLLSQFDAEQHVVTAAQEKASPTGELVEPLSRRELEVLHLMALGRTNPEIARQLIVSTGTVKAHTASIYRKLDVANRTEAAARARQLGILP